MRKTARMTLKRPPNDPLFAFNARSLVTLYHNQCSKYNDDMHSRNILRHKENRLD